MEYVFTERANGWGEWYATEGEYHARINIHRDGYISEAYAGVHATELQPGETMTLNVGAVRAFFGRAFPLVSQHPALSALMGIDTPESVLT